MNEATAREKMLREQRIQKEARAAGYAEGFSAGLSRAEESYSPRMTRLEGEVALLKRRLAALIELVGETIQDDATKVAPLERNPKAPNSLLR